MNIIRYKIIDPFVMSSYLLKCNISDERKEVWVFDVTRIDYFSCLCHDNNTKLKNERGNVSFVQDLFISLCINMSD